MNQYKLDPKAWGNSPFAEELFCSFARLVEVFGEPNQGEGFKVSAEWIFVDNNGKVFRLYDWKKTSLYQDDLPTPAELRKQSLYWNISGLYPEVEDFIAWVHSKVK